MDVTRKNRGQTTLLVLGLWHSMEGGIYARQEKGGQTYFSPYVTCAPERFSVSTTLTPFSWKWGQRGHFRWIRQ